MSEVYDTFWGHVSSLRLLIIRAVCVWTAATFAVFFFHSSLINFLLEPLKAEAMSLAILSPLEGLWVTFSLIFWGGIIVSFPAWLFSFYLFIKPALHPGEKEYARLFMGLVLFFLILGALFARYIIIPLIISYLWNLNSSFGQNFWSLGNYLNFIIDLFLSVEAMLQLVLFTFFAVHIGWISPSLMAKWRRHAFLSIFIMAAIVTPPDVFSQLLVALPLVLCYELAFYYGNYRTGI